MIRRTKLQTPDFGVFIVEEVPSSSRRVSGDAKRRNRVGDYDYVYGGTRIVSSTCSDAEAWQQCETLQSDESAIKNYLINFSLHNGALANFHADDFPRGFINSRVAGAVRYSP